MRKTECTIVKVHSYLTVKASNYGSSFGIFAFQSHPVGLENENGLQMRVLEAS